MRDPFSDRSNNQLYREAQVWMAVFTCLLAVFLYLVIKRMTGTGDEIPEHVMRSGVAQVVAAQGESENENELNGQFAGIQQPRSTRPDFGGALSFESGLVGLPKVDPDVRPVKIENQNDGSSERVSGDLIAERQMQLAAAFRSGDFEPAAIDSQTDVESKGERRARELAQITKDLPDRLDNMRSAVRQATAILPEDDPSAVGRPTIANSAITFQPTVANKNNGEDVSKLADRFPRQKFELPEPAQISKAASVPKLDSIKEHNGFAPLVQKPEPTSDEGNVFVGNAVDADSQFDVATRSAETKKQVSLPNENAGMQPLMRRPAGDLGRRLLPRPLRSDTGFPATQPVELAKDNQESNTFSPTAANVRSLIEAPIKKATIAEANKLPSVVTQQPTLAELRPPVKPKPGPKTNSNSDADRTLTAVGSQQDNRFPKTHRVKSGDSFFSVAQNYYRDGRWFHSLYLANSDKVQDFDLLPEGTTLLIPSPDSLAERYPKFAVRESLEGQPSDSATNRIYVTKTNDTLFDISRRKLDQGSRYIEIIQQNELRLPKAIGASDILPPNLRLVLPVSSVQ